MKLLPLILAINFNQIPSTFSEKKDKKKTTKFILPCTNSIHNEKLLFSFTYAMSNITIVSQQQLPNGI